MNFWATIRVLSFSFQGAGYYLSWRRIVTLWIRKFARARARGARSSLIAGAHTCYTRLWHRVAMVILAEGVTWS